MGSAPEKIVVSFKYKQKCFVSLLLEESFILKKVKFLVAWEWNGLLGKLWT